MLVIEAIITVFIGVIIINSIYMIVYTRFERALDRKREKNSYPSESKEEYKSQPLRFFPIRNIYNYFESFSYGLMRYNLLRVGRIPSFTVRRMLYRWVYCMDITSNTKINGGNEIRSPWNIHADRCIIGINCILDGRSGLFIGQDVVFGGGVHVWTQEHNVNDPYFRVLEGNSFPVRIESHAWICSDSTILPGCIIGEGAVIAARACVVKNCEPFSIYGGVPAKKIGERNRELVYHLERRPVWFFY